MLKKFICIGSVLFAPVTVFANARSCVPLEKIISPSRLLPSRDPANVWLGESDAFLKEPRSAVTFTDSSGNSIHAKLLSVTEGENGTKAYYAMQADGSPIILDSETYPNLSTNSESAAYWSKRREETDSFAKKYDFTNDLKYISYFENGEVHYGRMTQIIEKGKEILRVRDALGNYFPLTEDKLKNLLSSDASKKFFRETELPSGGKVSLPKNTLGLAQRKDKLLNPDQTFDISHAKKIGISGYSANGIETDTIFPAYQLSEGLGKTRPGRMAEKVKNIYNTETVYSKELNVATKSEGITNPNAKIWDSEKNLVREHAKVVNNQALIESGLANATEVHEIGHVVTHDHLQKGIPDPQGIIYRAQDGKVLFTTEERPNFYLKDGPSDEVRQFAFNIQNALHQRHTGELMEDFRRKEMISVSDVYGVNRENFLQALDSANEFANGLEIFHIRNSNLAQNARQKILENIRGDKLDPAHFSVYRFDSDPTFAFFRVILPEGKVDIPIVGEAFKSFVAPVEIPAVLADDGSTKTIRKYPYENFPGDAAELKDYALNYLQNELSMLDAQKIPLEKTLEKISELQKNPNRLMTRQEYFENRNLFIQVKKSVNLTPEKMLNLDWVIPHGNVKFRTKKLPIPTDPNYRPKFQFYNPKTTPKRASEN